jgi:hypothetical protein
LTIRRKRKRTLCVIGRGCENTGRSEKEENRKSLEEDERKKMEEKIKRLHKSWRKR